ncbi:hypothetical protein FACS189455_4990 [Bacteroidia bacterium]|nr:hypothetical protein FACS189455_4990 [Bacteroidia bacterium]
MADIPEKKNLKAEFLDLDDMMRPARIYIHDSLLYVINMGLEYGLSCYNLKTLKKVGDYFPFGSGPFEVLHLKRLQFIDSLVYGFDKRSGRLHQYKSCQFVNNDKTTPISVVKLQDVLSNNVLVVNDKFFSNSFTHPDFRFSIFDNIGQYQKSFADLPDFGVVMSPEQKIESFLCDMELKPDKSSIFVSYMQSDLIEIYSAEGVLHTRMHGPDHFFPELAEVSNETLKRVGAITGKTRDGYYNPVTFDDEIWVQYSGKVFDPTKQDSFLNNKIIVFDWKGSPLRMYITDISFFSLAVDREAKTIYGIGLNPDYSIVKFRY